jgi:CDP-diacylglycerol--serine O-phosphatidyltransferase
LRDVDSTVAARKTPPRAAYALPTLFTAGNIFLGYIAILRSIEGAVYAGPQLGFAAEQFTVAAKCIGIAMVLDGLDGRIARLTNTTSEFGREMDSLSDVISFGIAPAVLAWAWGVHLAGESVPSMLHDHLDRAGKLITFLFLLCGAARLARFNVQKNPKPKNPGRPTRKYFVGLPIPAAAALIAAIVFAADGYPVTYWPYSVAWMALLVLLSFLMVSTWRYYAFKDNAFLRPRSPLTIILAGALIVLIWFWDQPVLLALASAYVAGGVVLRLGGLFRRGLRKSPRETPMENPIV